MKFCVLLLLLVAYRNFAHHLTLASIRNQWKEPIASYRATCIRETGASDELIEAFYRYGKMPNDRSFMCYLKCCGIKAGVYSAMGKVDVRKWAEAFNLDLSMAQKCVDTVWEQDVCKKGYLLVKCVYDNLSRQFSP